MSLDHVRQPLWWAPALARYRRLSYATRAVLDVVVAEMWGAYRPELPPDTVAISPAKIARLAGYSLRHTQRAVLALAGEPGDVVCMSTITRGHGILRDLTAEPSPVGTGRFWRPAARVLQLRPWQEWWWRPSSRSGAELAIAEAEAGTVPLTRGQRMARILVRHLQWSTQQGKGEAADVPNDPHFERWARQLGSIHADEDDLRMVLGYIAATADPFWRHHIAGRTAAWRLRIAWEGLYLLARAAARAA